MASKSVAKRRRHYFPKRFHRKAKFTLPIAVVAGFVPVAAGLWNRRTSAQSMADYLQQGFTGITPGTGQFNLGNLRIGMMPVLAGFIVHMIAGKLGINRAIGRAGIPFIRI
jgi:hypothetical protein